MTLKQGSISKRGSITLLSLLIVGGPFSPQEMSRGYPNLCWQSPRSSSLTSPGPQPLLSTKTPPWLPVPSRLQLPPSCQQAQGHPFPSLLAKENIALESSSGLFPAPCFCSAVLASPLLQENKASRLLPRKPMLAPHLCKICCAAHLNAAIHTLGLSKETW